ncbi:N-acetyllactosaminide beta-1,3-N-acetylglucosaminyltransferase 2-like isoform X3 [Ctenocephalides felis]|uniref:N-acetyllactosaminide beta-1,3-N-acetylglucosaminyltransferase 2-like isoform X3 n=1 Tax=Ctenocephalides felis TaxID=7515 RepID=UPI000E6E19C8|nr:N-acetyllactosaminide beta-1,3-N-acetylglucosaminyltransferase 2-like isoform X3 [Ctenocephalides felis]
MERFDLQSEETLLIRNSYRTHRSNNYNDCSSGISVPTVHVCGQQFANKHINGFNIRIKRYLLMCMVTLAILLLLYIPVYHHIMPSRIASIPGWSYNTSRELSTYVKPNLTALHEPNSVCTQLVDNGPIFLMIVVCSAVKNFEERKAIRSTWGNINQLDYPAYIKKIAALKLHNINVTSVASDNNSTDNIFIPNDWGTLYRYYSNIYHASSKRNRKDEMTPKGVKDAALKDKCDELNSNLSVNVKVLFLLGKPHIDNDTDFELQHLVDIESEQYQDIIQENFIDSYNNLTLKSVMMLKWVSSHCSHSVQYLMKVDDDMFVNVNKLIYELKCLNLKNTSNTNLASNSSFNSNKNNHLLMGSLIKGAKPIADSANKWYSPQYMYSGKVYPPYLSGTGYVMSIETANTLYKTALVTPIFHLEDIYITGICAYKAKIKPLHSPLFSYQKRAFEYCEYLNYITSHQLTPSELFKVQELFVNHTESSLDKCFKKTTKT